MATPAKKTAPKAKAAPKKAAAKAKPKATRKVVTSDDIAKQAPEPVQLSPDEIARRKRKETFFSLVEQGIPVPYVLQQEFAPAQDAPVPAPVAAAPVAAQAHEPVDPYDADNGRSELKPRIIRNMRRVTVNMRLDSGGEKPFRVSLKPRGTMGDTVRIPAKCTDDVSFTASLEKGLFEIITRSEQQSINYGSHHVSHAERMGILDWQGNPVKVGETTRDADRVVSRTQYDTNQQGNVVVQEQQMGREQTQPQPNQQFHPQQPEPDYRSQHAQVTPVGPKVVSMPGSDPQLTAQFQHDYAEASVPQGYAPVLQPGTGRPLDTVQNELGYVPLNPHATPTGEATGASAMPPQPPVVQRQVEHYRSDVPAGTPSRQVTAPQG